VGEVLVLGGYGYSGSRCVRELAETTQLDLIIAGRSIQRAEQVAFACGDRAEAAYANAADRRTLLGLISDASAVVACCGGDWTAALELSLEARVPFIGVGGLRLEPRSWRILADRAWQAQVPVILQAGAVPGLPGIVAEYAVRRHGHIHALRIASSGPWQGTDTARRDVAVGGYALDPITEYVDGRHVRARQRITRCEFPEPMGTLLLSPARSLDLEQFAETHCVDNLVYLEPRTGRLRRGLERLLGVGPTRGFNLALDVIAAENCEDPAERILLESEDAPTASAALVGALVRAVLAGGVMKGLSTPREALNPSAALGAIEKRGVRVRVLGDEDRLG
jgi:hypothetical protein